MKERRRLMRMLRVVNIVPSEAERLGRAVAQEAGWNSHQTAMLLLRSLSAYHRTKTLHRALKRLLP